MSSNIRITGTLASGLSEEELAKLEERAGLPPRSLTGEAQAESEVLSAVELDQLREWARMRSDGATQERLRRETDRLVHLFNDDDVRWIINDLKKRVGRPPRERRKRRNRVDWSTAEGIITKLEIRAWYDRVKKDGHGQEKACEQWQEWCRNMPMRRNWCSVHKIDAGSLKKEVFGR
jgi:hypothetical protein